MNDALEQAKAERARRVALASAKAERERRQTKAPQRPLDSMGFPTPPQGGVSTNSQAVSEFKPKLGAMVDGGVQGASFGLQDEFRGLSQGLFGGISDAIEGNEGRTFGERYTEGRDGVRAHNVASQTAEPLAYAGGQIVGATAPALAVAPLTGGGSMVGTAGRGAALGAVEGGLHGLGNADGVDPLKSTVQGAALGGLVGGAAPLAVGAAAGVKRAVSAGAKRAVSDPVSGVIEGMLNKANPNKANRAISSALRSSKKSPQQVADEIAQAGAAGQPEFRLMDALGTSGQRLASGVSRGGGDASAEIAEFLASRQSGQAERVGSFVDDAFGMGGGTAKGKVDELTAARGAAANTAYDAARGNAAPVDVRGAMGVIDQRIGGMKGSNVTGDAIDGKLSGYRQRLAADPAPNGEISRELSDFDRVLGVKQSVQDDIGAAVRAGRNNEARELGKLVSELDAALEAASPSYRTANDGFREASGVIDAVDQGSKMSRPSVRPADALDQFGTMSPDQQGAARIGYGDQLLAKIEANTAPTANKAKVLQSPKRDAEAAGMALDPSGYQQRLARENTMWETQNRALQGSKTADNLEDISNVNQASSGLGKAAKSALNFQLGDAASNLWGVLGPVAKGQSDATRQLIAKALMSSDPQKALAPILRQEMTGSRNRRAIEALLRNSGRGSASQEIAPQAN
jgi:hypothetical protein